MATRLLTPQRIVNLASDPAAGTSGEIYYNTTISAYKYYNGSAWVEIASGGGGSSSASGSVLNIPNTLVLRDTDRTFDISGVDFDTNASAAATAQVGRLLWDDGEGTLTFTLKGGNVNLGVGKEEVVLCYNGTGSAIPKGKVVYIVGAQGQRPSIALSSASAESTSSKTLGITAEEISNGSEGFVATFGVVGNLNTASFTAGNKLWLSTTPGELTETVPTQPDHSVFIGYCLSSNMSSGRVFINPQNGYELQELHNVLITSPLNDQVLTYESATGLWKNKTPTGGGGGGSVQTDVALSNSWWLGV
jgi:hypothetical protein